MPMTTIAKRMLGPTKLSSPKITGNGPEERLMPDVADAFEQL